MCNAKVVFPPDSGPNISIIRPFGTPPTPKATSNEKHPVETISSRLHILDNNMNITFFEAKTNW